MSNNTKTVDARQIRDLSAFELDSVAGGAATNPKPTFPGPCFPRPPKPPLQTM
jgi:hypothetical protein